MNFTPVARLKEEQVQSGLKLVIKDGLATEAMATLTGGTFLIAIALHLGASNFQIGLLAALPTITNLFQLFAIWLVQHYKNRRAIAVFCSFIARFPLICIGLIPFFESSGIQLQTLIFLLFIHYLFGSVVGPVWNSWMKDLVPEHMLGTYFSKRSRKIQLVNVALSILIALLIDYIKNNYPQQVVHAYSLMFLAGGAFGILSVYALSRTPEPQLNLVNENFLRLFIRPWRDKNFRSLMFFNAAWAFSLNLAVPFFSVYLLKTLHLPLSYIISTNLVSQLSGIFFIKIWGRFADHYSNKTIIRICAPVYILCIVSWAFLLLPQNDGLLLTMLVIINICSGMATSGINLSMSNIGLKLASKNAAVVYISARNIVIALSAALAPLVGGWLADFFSAHRLVWNIQWKDATGAVNFPVLFLQQYNYLFLMGALLALLSLRYFKSVREQGEVQKDKAMKVIRRYWQCRINDATNKKAIYLLMHQAKHYVNRVSHSSVTKKRA